ncbi:MAG: IS4 family transposase [Bacteroidetes bacterium]|nr:IS4 family transposase [Bacteroidota bacterium]MBT5426249.1 IS4 family transposase [Bacteroidota bacterium]
MPKSTHFTGQPIFGQLLKFMNRSTINSISAKHDADRYVKKLTTYKHLVIMLYAVLEGCSSLREVIVGLLADANKLGHLGLDYMPKRSTYSDANKRRSSKVFGDIYMNLYKKHASLLSDSRYNDIEARRLFIMDSTTITLFKEILKGAGRKPLEGKKKGGIKAHTLINSSENVPCLIRYSAAAHHDSQFLKEIKLTKGSFITFDKAYVDYRQYETFTKSGVFYVTRLKTNAKFKLTDRYGIYKDEKDRILEDADIEFKYKDKEGNEQIHKSRRIIYQDPDSGRLFEFVTNNFDLDASSIAQIYQKRWQIETLFKQIKQNFPLKYFLGDNVNAIEIQIWVAMLANLLISLVRSKIQRSWSFSNMVSVIRQQLMNYINIYRFLEDPEGAWIAVNKCNKINYQGTLFPETRGAWL